MGSRPSLICTPTGRLVTMEAVDSPGSERPEGQERPITVTPRRGADAIHAELLKSCTPGAPDEALLVELAATSASLVFQVEASANLLGQLLPTTLADPRRAVIVAKVLAELVSLTTALARRCEGSLSVAASLRSQRQLVGRAR